MLHIRAISLPTLSSVSPVLLPTPALSSFPIFPALATRPMKNVTTQSGAAGAQVPLFKDLVYDACFRSGEN